MDRVRLIFVFISVGFSFSISHGQQIGNYVTNGSFEDYYACSPGTSNKGVRNAKGWSGIDSINCYGGQWMSTCYGFVPLNGNTYQWPRTGKAYNLTTVYCDEGFCAGTYRAFMKNRLRGSLQAGKTYCVRFYLNIANTSPFGVDGFGAYLGDSSFDTIKKCVFPWASLIPQIKCPQGVAITDTINWVLVSGTFVATGTEKFMILGNFNHNGIISLGPLYGPHYPSKWSDVCFDDVSCIEYNLPAFAGADKLIYAGDSTFIGRQPDWAIDPGCIWYKLPNMTTSIDTVSGLWVKPTITSTYVVRQELDCSPVKWDTVIVTINTNLVDLNRLQKLADNIKIAPNPTAGNLKIFFSGQTSMEFSSFSIYNSRGQFIRDGELTGTSVDIGTSDLPPGLYEIHFKSRFGTVTKKFVRTSD